MHTSTVSVQLYRPVALALRARGFCPEQFFRDLGVVPPTTASWDVRMPLERMVAVWDRLLEVTGERHFALEAAECVDLAMCDLVTSLIANSRTVSEALRRKLGYQPLVSDTIEWSLSTGKETRLALHERSESPASAPMADFMLGTQHMLMRRFGPAGWRLSFVSFRRARPACSDFYERLFGLKPKFGSSVDELGFEGSLLEAPMPRRNDSLGEVLERCAEHLLSVTPRAATFGACVRERLREGIDPGIARVGAHLGVGTRTLQRRLHEEGTSYSALLNGAQRAVAERLLWRQELSISEVAHTLGFCDVSAFHRAFVRWTGVTPGAFCKLLPRNG
jgi:AraC-like DNA-binding protein